METLHAVLKEEAPRLPAAGLGDARSSPQRILDRCLAKATEGRYASLADGSRLPVSRAGYQRLRALL